MNSEESQRLRRVAEQHPALQLLVLHGSRARARPHARSDWDLAYLTDGEADPPLDHVGLLVDLIAALGTDAVDLVDLAGASAVLRFHVARDGRPIYESRAGAFTDYAIEASLYWCDIEPVVRRAHAAVLAELD